ncbi:hypothetical protein WISP_98690 [Willisornis vidua]|uniref:Uncharacterized protein n=1 Tax=Willisornis vidua TaxID=1566151 RepID=A0ABQ9D062_9PASS|nr:hypothetical protein WISP_98690 [Willisornis vidua]
MFLMEQNLNPFLSYQFDGSASKRCPEPGKEIAGQQESRNSNQAIEVQGSPVDLTAPSKRSRPALLPRSFEPKTLLIIVSLHDDAHVDEVGNLASQKSSAKCKGLLSCLLTVTPEVDFGTDSGYRRDSLLNTSVSPVHLHRNVSGNLFP